MANATVNGVRLFYELTGSGQAPDSYVEAILGFIRKYSPESR
jgi:hypothetical protein